MLVYGPGRWAATMTWGRTTTPRSTSSSRRARAFSASVTVLEGRRALVRRFSSPHHSCRRSCELLLDCLQNVRLVVHHQEVRTLAQMVGEGRARECTPAGGILLRHPGVGVADKTGDREWERLAGPM